MEEWDGRSFGDEKKSVSLAELKKRYPINTVLRVLSGHDYAPQGQHHGWLSMPCPFHEDRKPSARINVVAGRFHCHSCQVSGDIFDVVQTTLGLADIKEAREWIISNV